MLKRGRRQDEVEMPLHDGAGELVGRGTGTPVAPPHLPLEPVPEKGAAP